MTCKKAQGFLESAAIEIGEKSDATKDRITGPGALRLLDGMTILIAARGKNLAVFDLRKKRPDDETLLGHMLGPTGNLRAPTARVGKTLVVGFSEAAYRQALRF